MNNKKVALYIRVSTQEQAEEGYSIAEQTERLKKYCEAMGWIAAGTYIDPGFSGANIDRPALNKMITDIETNAVDMVLVYKLDRLSRSQKDTLYLIEDVFLKNHVEFVSMCENFDTSSPFGRAMIGILSVFAQLEREQIKERMAMGHIGRAKEGYWRGGSGSPIGYDYIDGELKVNEYEALQIREVFDLFLKGNTLHGICRIMKSKYTNSYSSWSHSSIVGKILKNTTYIGKIRYKGVEYDGVHEPIIDNDTFNAVQLRYKEYEKTLGKSQKSAYVGKHLLSGIMYCGNCGARYFTYMCKSKKHGDYYYYKCYSRDGNSAMKTMDGCKNPNYREHILDSIIINEIKKLCNDPQEIDKISNQKLSTIDNRPNILKSRIAEIEKQINKLMDLYQFETLSINDLNKRILPLQEERKNLENQLNAFDIKPLLSIDNAKKIIKESELILDNNDLEDKRLLINSLISKVTIYDDRISINWKFTV